MSASSFCKDCGKGMWWARTDKGNPMPLDLLPVPDGNVILIGTAGVGDSTPIAHVLSNADRADRMHEGKQLFKMHRATCGTDKALDPATLFDDA